MTLIDGRVGGEEVDVFSTFRVVYGCTRGGIEDDGERVVAEGNKEETMGQYRRCRLRD